MKTLVLLGGYGAAGRALAPLLLRETQARLVIAGRSRVKAEAFAQGLAQTHPGRVQGAEADAERPETLSLILQGAAMLLDLSSAADQVGSLARTALEAKVDFLDIHFQARALEQLAPLADEFQAAGRLLLTQAGCHPGLPSALVRAAAAEFEVLDTALLGMGMRLRVENETTAQELVDELMVAKGQVFREGAWRPATGRDVQELNLGPRFGSKACYPMFMEELTALPGQLGLKQTGVYVAGFDPLTDWLSIPLILLCGRLGLNRAKPLLRRLFTATVNACAGPRQGMSFALTATGRRQGRPATLHLVVDHESPYALTAIPVAASLLQYLDGSLHATGLRYMGQAVDPLRLLADMARLGAGVAWNWSEP